MSRTLKFALATLLLAVALIYASGFFKGFPSARTAPSRAETIIARTLHSWAIPSEAKNQKNPLSSSPEILSEAMHHFADHCAQCHSNDGSGSTEMGRNFYPRVPDMRAEATQHLTDGELYYIIHNGIRWTGMPAWGESHGNENHEGDSAHADQDTWKLVLFIRHLPQLTSAEVQEMQRHNPKSPAEMEEEKQEEDFLNGGSPAPKSDHHHEAHK